MAYLNPRYNGKVGVYRTNEIERFGTAPVTYDIAGDEYFAFKFVCTAKLSVSTQTAFVYYSSLGTITSYTALNISINRPGLNEPQYSFAPNGILQSLSGGAWNNYVSVARQQTITSASGNWDFTVGTIGDTENDQTNLRVGNTYWMVSKWSGDGFNLQTTYPSFGTAYPTTCKVLRSGIWVTASTSAYFNFTNIS